MFRGIIAVGGLVDAADEFEKVVDRNLKPHELETGVGEVMIVNTGYSNIRSGVATNASFKPEGVEKKVAQELEVGRVKWVGNLGFSNK